jgi:hypothetical protein
VSWIYLAGMGNGRCGNGNELPGSIKRSNCLTGWRTAVCSGEQLSVQDSASCSWRTAVCSGEQLSVHENSCLFM